MADTTRTITDDQLNDLAEVTRRLAKIVAELARRVEVIERELDWQETTKGKDAP